MTEAADALLYATAVAYRRVADAMARLEVKLDVDGKTSALEKLIDADKAKGND